MRSAYVLPVVVVMFACTGVSGQELLLDTGPITGQFAKGLSHGSWIAHQFLVSAPTQVTSIEGFMYGDQDVSEPPGDVVGALYSQGNDGLPNERIFEDSFKVDQTGRAGANWYGLKDLSWSIEPGTYWAVFAVDVPGSFFGGMPFETGNHVWAFRTDPSQPGEPPLDPFWALGDESDRIGVRITGRVVPEPTACLQVFWVAAVLAGRRPLRKGPA